MLLAMIDRIDIVEEESMPTRSWRLRRRPSPRVDGQERWDRAYLRLMQWTAPSQPPLPVPGQEDSHDGRPVCARLDPAPDPRAND
jgi:hypothetical protein